MPRKTKQQKVNESHEDVVKAISRRCRGSLPTDIREEINQLLAEGDNAKARLLDRANRAGCGYNFNLTILAGPLDGKVHDYKCPDCGIEGTYRAPWFE